MFRSKKAKLRKAEKTAEKARAKAEAKARAENSVARKFIREHGPSVLGIRIPGFFKIHMRYAKRSFSTWFVLFIAPFLVSIMVMGIVARRYLDINPTDLQLYIVAFFLIAVAFFFAERHRKFRRIYVVLVPALIIIYGLATVNLDQGRFPGNIIKFAILILYPAWWLWKRASDEGYKALSDGADPDYRPGHDLYIAGDYEDAFVYLEPSAKRGHMKSLYLMGHAYENGNGRARDRVRAAKLYDKAGRKGYMKARRAFDTLFSKLNKDEKKRYDTDIRTSGTEELF